MIRFVLPVGQSLEDLVDAHDPTWQTTYADWSGEGNPWGKVKKVFAKLQFGKCAYCERRVQSGSDTNKYESDVEHYRPKKATTIWKSSQIPRPIQAGFSTGYVWLATNVSNYVLACKTCNSEYKGNHFPIAGRIGQAGQTITELNLLEQPYLLYPIGNLDDDPEDLIEWDGILPKPKISELADPYRHWRARITIEFFELDLREDVQQGCAEQICRVWSALQSRDKKDFAALNKLLDENRLPHTACIRAFLKLFLTNPEKANKRVQQARRLLGENPYL